MEHNIYFFCVFPCLALKWYQLQGVTSHELISLVRFHPPSAPIIVYILNESYLCCVASCSVSHVNGQGTFQTAEL